MCPLRKYRVQRMSVPRGVWTWQLAKIDVERIARMRSIGVGRAYLKVMELVRRFCPLVLSRSRLRAARRTAGLLCHLWFSGGGVDWAKLNNYRLPGDAVAARASRHHWQY
jgi:hypothetical protein